MTWREPIACVFAVLWAVAPCRAQGQASSEEDKFIQLEREWDAAFFRRDVAFIEHVLADEFIAVYDDGRRGDKAKELAQVVEFNKHIDSSTMSDFTVKIFGDTAVVWFTRHLVGPSQGRTLELDFRFLDVFVRRDGRWQCITSQSTRVAGN